MANNGNGSRSPLPSFPNGKGIGRPTVYCEAVAEKICDELTAGHGLKTICDNHDDLPERATVLKWLFSGKPEHERFVSMYNRAREAQAECLADDLVDLSDGPGPGKEDDSVAVNRSRLRVDTRKWVAARLLPHRYGDRVEHQYSGNVNVRINLAGKPGDGAKVIDGEAEAPKLPKGTSGAEGSS